MKKRFVSILSICLLIAACMATVGAAERSSLYLDDYYVNAAALGNSEVIVEFEVDATRTMDTVGAACIVFQEKTSSGTWENVAVCYPVDYPSMFAYNTSSHGGGLAYTGVVGREYRGKVTVYAGNSTGEDTRILTTNTVTIK